MAVRRAVILYRSNMPHFLSMHAADAWYYSLFVTGCSYKMRFHYKFKPTINTDDLGKQVVEAMNALATLPRFCGNKDSVFEGFGAESNLQFEVRDNSLAVQDVFIDEPSGDATAHHRA